MQSDQVEEKKEVDYCHTIISPSNATYKIQYSEAFLARYHLNINTVMQIPLIQNITPITLFRSGNLKSQNDRLHFYRTHQQHFLVSDNRIGVFGSDVSVNSIPVTDVHGWSLNSDIESFQCQNQVTLTLFMLRSGENIPTDLAAIPNFHPNATHYCLTNIDPVGDAESFIRNITNTQSSLRTIDSDPTGKWIPILLIKPKKKNRLTVLVNNDQKQHHGINIEKIRKILGKYAKLYNFDEYDIGYVSEDDIKKAIESFPSEFYRYIQSNKIMYPDPLIENKKYNEISLQCYESFHHQLVDKINKMDQSVLKYEEVMDLDYILNNIKWKYDNHVMAYNSIDCVDSICLEYEKLKKFDAIKQVKNKKMLVVRNNDDIDEDMDEDDILQIQLYQDDIELLDRISYTKTRDKIDCINKIIENPYFTVLSKLELFHFGSYSKFCPVCAEDLGDQVKILPCHHLFHVKCIKLWLLIAKTCPLCRYDITQPNI